MTGVPNFMRGPTRVRQVVISYLQSAMPPMIDLCRTNWGLAPEMLPYPKKYDANDPYIGEGEYPLVGMYVPGDKNQRGTVDYDDAMAQEYMVEYNVRMFVAIASPQDANGNILEPPYGNAIQVRSDMLTIMRMCLLARNGLASGGQAYLIEETMEEDFPDPMISKSLGGKYLASGIISVQVRFNERLQLQPYGTADTITKDITNVGPDQPFQE